MDLPELPTVDGSPCEKHNCSLCCYDIEMILTNDDLARLQTARPGEDFWFQADDGYIQLRTQRIDTAHGQPCHFLEDGRCSVWADRPEGCRLYPAVWDDSIRAATLDADYCPHTDEFRLPASMNDATRRLATRLEQERAARMPSTP